eukprot:scaffold41566_cov34-Tisochrysis_lutea.AAC.6
MHDAKADALRSSNLARDSVSFKSWPCANASISTCDEVPREGEVERRKGGRARTSCRITSR